MWREGKEGVGGMEERVGGEEVRDSGASMGSERRSGWVAWEGISMVQARNGRWGFCQVGR